MGELVLYAEFQVSRPQSGRSSQHGINKNSQKGLCLSIEKLRLLWTAFVFESLALRYSHEKRNPSQGSGRLFKLMRKPKKIRWNVSKLMINSISRFQSLRKPLHKDTYGMINVTALRNYISGEVETQPQQSHEQHESILEALKDNIDECMKILKTHHQQLKRCDIHPAYADKNN